VCVCGYKWDITFGFIIWEERGIAANKRVYQIGSGSTGLFWKLLHKNKPVNRLLYTFAVNQRNRKLQRDGKALTKIIKCHSGHFPLFDGKEHLYDHVPIRKKYEFNDLLDLPLKRFVAFRDLQQEQLVRQDCQLARLWVRIEVQKRHLFSGERIVFTN